MGLELPEFLKSLFTQPSDTPGVPAVEVSKTIPITATGYSRAQEIAAAVAKLTSLQQEAITIYPPKGTTTFCNIGLQHVANGMGCHAFDNMMATQIVQQAMNLCMSLPNEWREDSWERAVAHANKGGFAFFGMKAPPGEVHGHVASVAAKPMEFSGTWGCNVPVLANVGNAKTQGFNKLSKCFLLSERPLLKCILWKWDDTL